jgi:hypothetical protein
VWNRCDCPKWWRRRKRRRNNGLAGSSCRSSRTRTSSTPAATVTQKPTHSLIKVPPHICRKPRTQLPSPYGSPRAHHLKRERVDQIRQTPQRQIAVPPSPLSIAE